MKICLGLFMLLVLAACHKPLSTGNKSKNKFSDETLRTIYTYQHERNSAALLPYLSNPEPKYREAAAMAFASVQDMSVSPALAGLVTDRAPEVRKAAAYALGQTASPESVASLLAAIDQEPVNWVRAEMFEALGKSGTPKAITVLTNFDTPDTVTQAGQAWGLYRAALKATLPENAIRKTVKLLSASQSQQVKLAAAHTLARSGKTDLSVFSPVLVSAVRSAAGYPVRVALATALAKAKTPEAAAILGTLAATDPDFRVRIAAIRALKDQQSEISRTVALQHLAQPNPHVALTAAELIAQNNFDAMPNQAAALQPDWRTRALLFGAALQAATHKTALRQEIISRYQKSSNSYEKGALLTALSNDVNAYKFLEKETFSAANPVISTYGIEALSNMRKNKTFPDSLKIPFNEMLKRAIAHPDVAVTGTAATLLREPELNFKEAFPDYGFLTTALEKLTLPRDIEPYIELQKTIAYFEGQPEPEAPQNPSRQPINWELVQKIKTDQNVLITTSKGNITLQLFVEEAPGTVANFVELVEKGFYNNKYFHRVVPNFVAQAGCPRGDGWGSTDYTIRSEFANLHYEEGTVGMASAGKDTESCQWFIAHLKTPHLDGRYTIFAKVVAGMEVVHKLNIGDKIEKAALVK